MKRKPVILSLGIFLSFGAAAQTSDNFNSRPGITLEQVKGHLQSHCWAFPDFDDNRNGWTPGIEGDGAMVSGQSANPAQNTGIYSPVLDVPGNISISFQYKFNTAYGNGTRRWLKIYLADPDNFIVSLLDSIEFSSINPPAVYQYNKSFNRVGSGLYKLYINFQGIGGTTSIAIDKLSISAPLRYSSGCNEAPVAADDNITGLVTRTASGYICSNDYDPDLDPFSPYITNTSKDGSVHFNYDGSFSFTPNAGFSGNSTTFTYKICDAGYGSLCSNDAMVRISFPNASMLPASLTDFSGSYKDGGKVELAWTTRFESNSHHFEVERSLDGRNWDKAGDIKAQVSSTIKHAYIFSDHLSRNVVHKNDLYYRLKQIDLDGKVAISRILVVRVYNSRTLKMVSVTPNPMKNDIAVNIQLLENSFITMKIMNSSGTEIMRKAVKANVGTNSYMIDGSNKLQPGMYVLEVIINSKERMIVKLIKE